MTNCFWQELTKTETWCKGEAIARPTIDLPSGIYFAGIAANRDTVVIVADGGGNTYVTGYIAP